MTTRECRDERSYIRCNAMSCWLKETGLNCRQIADKLNAEGVTSWNGKKFYPELVFGVIRKARLKKQRLAHAVVEVRTTLKNGLTCKS